jgi:LPXTG-site transpeptidase (sortase) family protein
MNIRLNSTYSAIFFIAAAASVLQLSLLGNGLASRVERSNPAPAAAVIKHVTPTQGAVKNAGFVPTHITMTKVGIDLPVVSVPLKNGTWEVFDKVANFAQGTSLVNAKTGNVGIYGHDRLIDFTKIKQLVKDDTIIVYGNGQKATYSVVSSAVIKPTDVSVFNPTKEPMLTLTTCDGAFSQMRYMIRAKLVKIEKDVHSN